jgi:hypothetical protein
MIIKCDKINCTNRGENVYCQIDKGLYRYERCFFYNTQTSNSRDKQMSEGLLKKLMESGL